MPPSRRSGSSRRTYSRSIASSARTGRRSAATRRRSTTSAGSRLPTAVSLVAAEQARKLRAKRVADDLAFLGHPANSKENQNFLDPDYQMTKFRGRGGYTFGDFMRQAEPYANRFINKGIPNLLNAGNKIAGFANQFAGRGAYTQTNNLFQGPHSRQIHSVQDETGDFIFSHTEFLQSVKPTSEDFQTQFTTNINPGLSGFAPMLAQIAQYFEEYEMLQLVFHFKSTVTDGNTTAAGTVLTATQYNPTNNDFTSEQTMDNYEHASRCKVTEDMFHGVECDPSKLSGTTSEYIRTGDLPLGQDIKTYDLAKFQLVTVGAQANLNIGRLYVTYSVRLSKMKQLEPSSNPVLLLPFSTLFLSNTAFGGPSGTISATNCFGNGTPVLDEGSLSVSLLSVNRIIFPVGTPQGNYYIHISWRGNQYSGDLNFESAFSSATYVHSNNVGTTAWLNNGGTRVNSDSIDHFDCWGTVQVTASGAQQAQITLPTMTGIDATVGVQISCVVKVIRVDDSFVM
jgi:hypothetical protein